MAMTVTVDAHRTAPNHPLGSDAPATPHYLAEPNPVASPTPMPQAHRAATVPVISAHLPASAVRYLAKGEPLYLQGEAAVVTYLVEEGLVALSLATRPDRERIVGLAGPGDLVGALTADQREYLESAHALSHGAAVRGVTLGQPLAGHEPSAELADALSRAAGEHMVQLTRLLEDSEVPVPARVARTLLRLGERFGQSIDHDGGMSRAQTSRPRQVVRLTLPLTHETIAGMVGAARETTTSTIEQLRRRGLVHGTRGRYVLDVAGLTAYANEAAAVS